MTAAESPSLSEPPFPIIIVMIIIMIVTMIVIMVMAMVVINGSHVKHEAQHRPFMCAA